MIPSLFTQITLLIGRVNANSIQLLGTGFLVSNDGKVATTKHVVGTSPSDIVVLLPHINNFDDYQDTTDTFCKPIPADVIEVDPIRDICILKTGLHFDAMLPKIGSFDNVKIGDDVEIFGFPHCLMGRRVLTYQKTIVGAKILLESNTIKSKHAVINIQSRPGQSGSVVYDRNRNEIVGILVGAYIPHKGISLGGINPQELHQTTHCISAEYILKMI